MPLGTRSSSSLRSRQIFQEDLFTQLKRDLRNVVGDLSGQWFPNLWRSLGMVGHHLQRFIRPWCQIRTLQRLTCRRQLTHSHQQLCLFARRSKSSVHSAPPASSNRSLSQPTGPERTTGNGHPTSLLKSILPWVVCATTCDAEGEIFFSTRAFPRSWRHLSVAVASSNANWSAFRNGPFTTRGMFLQRPRIKSNQNITKRRGTTAE